MLTNYEQFMQNHICFSFFKDYIKENFNEEYIYLMFWIDFYIFKQQFYEFTNNNKKDHSDSSFRSQQNLNIKTAIEIYKDYFENQQQLRNSATNSLTVRYNFIEFPVDINEKVEEAANRGFEIPDLFEVFDEAYAFINSKLYNRYLYLCRNPDYYKELEKIIPYIDLYEIKDRSDIFRRMNSDRTYATNN